MEETLAQVQTDSSGKYKQEDLHLLSSVLIVFLLFAAVVVASLLSPLLFSSVIFSSHSSSSVFSYLFSTYLFSFILIWSLLLFAVRRQTQRQKQTRWGPAELNRLHESMYHPVGAPAVFFSFLFFLSFGDIVFGFECIFALSFINFWYNIGFPKQLLSVPLSYAIGARKIRFFVGRIKCTIMGIPKSHSSYASSQVSKRTNDLCHLLQCGARPHDSGGEHPVSLIIAQWACVHTNDAHVVYCCNDF